MVFHAGLQEDTISPHVHVSSRRQIAPLPAFVLALPLGRQPGPRAIFNTDQGSQFTGAAFTSLLADHGIIISMDGKGAWRDNVFVERLWRSVKYEEVYLRAYETVGEAQSSIGRYLDFYNGRRPHSSLDERTPDQSAATGGKADIKRSGQFLDL